MTNELHVAAIDDGSGLDGIGFTAQIGQKKINGSISRNCLLSLPHASDEPLLGIFEGNKATITAAVSKRIAMQSDEPIRLSEVDFT